MFFFYLIGSIEGSCSASKKRFFDWCLPRFFWKSMQRFNSDLARKPYHWWGHSLSDHLPYSVYYLLFFFNALVASERTSLEVSRCSMQCTSCLTTTELLEQDSLSSNLSYPSFEWELHKLVVGRGHCLQRMYGYTTYDVVVGWRAINHYILD